MEDPKQTTSDKLTLKPAFSSNLSPKKVAGGGRIMIVMAVLFLVGASMALGYFYYAESQKAADATERADLSAKEIARLKANATAQTGNTTYAATVGKFSVTLPNTYYIIKNVDGDFEGGPTASLNVGTAINDNNAINIDLASQLSVDAWPKATYQNSFDNFLQLQLADAQVTKLDATTVAGGPAQQYKTQDSFDVLGKKILFEHADYYYSISMSGVDSAGEDKSGNLQAVIEGFAYTQ